MTEFRVVREGRWWEVMITKSIRIYYQLPPPSGSEPTPRPRPRAHSRGPKWQRPVLPPDNGPRPHKPPPPYPGTPAKLLLKMRAPTGSRSPPKCGHANCVKPANGDHPPGPGQGRRRRTEQNDMDAAGHLHSELSSADACRQARTRNSTSFRNHSASYGGSVNAA